MFSHIQKLSDALVQALAPKATVKASETWECDLFCYCDPQGRSRYKSCYCYYWGTELNQVCGFTCSVAYYGC